MPSADVGRRRVRLTIEHLAVLGQLVHGTPLDGDLGPYRDELVAAELIDGDGEVPDFLGRLVRALAAPALLIEVEVSGPGGVVGHGAVVNGPGEAYTSAGWPHDREVEYAPIQPELLAGELARMIALRPAGVCEAGPHVLVAPLQLVEGALTTLEVLRGRDDWDTARGELGNVVGSTMTETDEGHRERLARVLASIQLTWRVTVSWPDENAEGGRAARGLVALDCGQWGYWRRDLPEEPLRNEDITAETPVRLLNVAAKVLWADLAALFPEKGVDQYGTTSTNT